MAFWIAFRSNMLSLGGGGRCSGNLAVGGRSPQGGPPSQPPQHRQLNPIVPRPPRSSRLLAPPEALLSSNHGTQRASDRGPASRASLSSTPTLHSPRQ